MNKEKNRFNVEEHTTLDGRIIDVFPISHRYIHNLEQQVKTQKEVIDKAINAIDLVIELIKQQPTEDDKWILDRLNGFKIILEDKEVSDE